MNVKFIKNPIIIAMIVLVVIVGGIVGGAAYVLNAKANQSDSKANANASTATDGQKPADAKNPQAAPSATSDGAKPSPTAQPGAATTAPAPAGSATNVTSIAISSSAFSPTAVTIKKGATITWTNKDTANHAIAETDSGSGASSGPHSPQLKPNESYTYTFTTPGTYHYQCAIKPALTGTITVTN
jgi:plastocyanin